MTDAGMTGPAVTDQRVSTDCDGDIAVLTLDHKPSRNGLGPAMRSALMAGFVEATADPTVRAIVVTGAHGAFSAGSDIAAMLDQDVAERTARLVEFQHFLAGWSELPVPVLVAIDGAAAGGGVSMALASDWAVAAAGSIFVSGWLAIGLVPDAGALWWLVRTMGPKRAFEWVHSTRRMSAEEALAAGLVTATCPAGEAIDVALHRARELLSVPAAARASTKRLLRTAVDALDLGAFLDAELDAQRRLFGGAEHRAAVQGFLDR